MIQSTNELRNRMEKIAEWLEYIEEVYSDLSSRPAETDSLPGFDHQSRIRPCEHRKEWYRGKLCVACDNTAWRACAPGEEGYDPYSRDLPKTTTGIKLDESTGAKKARELARISSVIDALRSTERIRAGLEASEGPYDRAARVVASRIGDQGREILRSLYGLYIDHPTLYHLAQRKDERGLAALALVVPGRIKRVPFRL